MMRRLGWRGTILAFDFLLCRRFVGVFDGCHQDPRRHTSGRLRRLLELHTGHSSPDDAAPADDSTPLARRLTAVIAAVDGVSTALLSSCEAGSAGPQAAVALADVGLRCADLIRDDFQWRVGAASSEFVYR